MKRTIAVFGLYAVGLSVVLIAQGAVSSPGSYSELRGAYLGQKPPGTVPELFAPGVVSTGMDDLNAVFSRDGNEFFFAVKLPVRGRHVLLTMAQADGRWSAPALLPFSGRYDDADPALSPDGTTLYFASARPTSPDREAGDWNIWASARTPGGWGPPRLVEPPVNSEGMEVYPSFTGDGTLYFSSGRPSVAPAGGIFRAVPDRGRFPSVEVFDARIAADYGGGDVCIFPDERTIVFSSGRPGGIGSSDLYVSFRRAGGGWSAPQNLGPAVNSPQQEYCPSLSPDGKYFFFSSYRRPVPSAVPPMRSLADILRVYQEPQNGNGDVYWVDASVIHALRPD